MRLTTTTLMVLDQFLRRPDDEIYGLELSRSLDLKTGTVYPILTRLVDRGWLTERWEEVEPTEAKRPRRRLYQLTAYGRDAGIEAVRNHLASFESNL